MRNPSVNVSKGLGRWCTGLALGSALKPWKQEPATVKTVKTVHDEKREEPNACYDDTMALHCTDLYGVWKIESFTFEWSRLLLSRLLMGLLQLKSNQKGMSLLLFSNRCSIQSAWSPLWKPSLRKKSNVIVLPSSTWHMGIIPIFSASFTTLATRARANPLFRNLSCVLSIPKLLPSLK